MPVSTNKVTSNHDVSGLSRRLNRFIIEVIKSASSNASDGLNSFDRTRLLAYLTAIRAYVAWVVAQPALDLPETNPRAIALVDDPEIPAIENESVTDIVRLLVICRDELTSSQSARMATGLITYDAARHLAIVTKVENLVTQYIDQVTPVDTPESHPDTPSTGPGSTGTML